MFRTSSVHHQERFLQAAFADLVCGTTGHVQPLQSNGWTCPVVRVLPHTKVCKYSLYKTLLTMDRWGPKHVELTYVMNKTHSLKHFVYLVGLHIYSFQFLSLHLDVFQYIPKPFCSGSSHSYLSFRSQFWLTTKKKHYPIVRDLRSLLIKLEASCAVSSVCSFCETVLLSPWSHQPAFLTNRYKHMCEKLIRTPFLVFLFYVFFLHGQTLVTVNLCSSNCNNTFRIPTPKIKSHF